MEHQIWHIYEGIYLVISEVDPCVYHNKGLIETISVIFVDDGILCGVKELTADNIITYLKTVFKWFKD
jgi:hypothetical protein